MRKTLSAALATLFLALPAAAKPIKPLKRSSTASTAWGLPPPGAFWQRAASDPSTDGAT